MRSNTPIDSRITSSSSGVHAALWLGQRQGRAIYDEEQEGKDDNGDGGGWQSEIARAERGLDFAFIYLSSERRQRTQSLVFSSRMNCDDCSRQAG